MTLSVENLTKRYASGRGILDATLRVDRGEIVALIGPSGCGKTTLLRAVGGLVTPDSGRIVLDEADITALPPERRNIGLIFQNYALFPHLSVFDNVAYGLRARGKDKAAIKEAVDRALALVDLAGRDGRIDQLSGGEQQRVAVARAVVTEPRALLLDEPLSNLDTNLRHRMREGLRGILGRLGIPAIHVTHDQEEALAIADRVVVLDAGTIIQDGTPEEIYARPRSAFVARFVGAANVVPGRAVRVVGRMVEVAALGGVVLADVNQPPPPGSEVQLAVRPEVLELFPPSYERGWNGTVVSREFLGPTVEVVCDVEGQRLVARVPARSPGARVEAGARVRIFAEPAQIHLMSP